jgi:hypothetical protein
MNYMLIISFMGVALAFFFAGYLIGAASRTPLAFDVKAYIEKNLPDKWAAYKKGVHEGYEQGLRDGQEMPDEPA